MERYSGLTQQQIDELLAGRLPEGLDASDELVAIVSRLRETVDQPMPDTARESHLRAMFEAMPVPSRADTAAGLVKEYGAGGISRSMNLRGAMRKLIPILQTKLAAVLVLLLGSGVAMAAAYDELPPEVQSAVDSVVGTLGLSSVDDIEVTEYEVEDDGASVEFEGTLNDGGEVEYESGPCETELEVEQASSDGTSETESEFTQSSHLDDCEDDDELEGEELEVEDEVDDDECEVDSETEIEDEDDLEVDDESGEEEDCEVTTVTTADDEDEYQDSESDEVESSDHDEDDEDDEGSEEDDEDDEGSEEDAEDDEGSEEDD